MLPVIQRSLSVTRFTTILAVRVHPKWIRVDLSTGVYIIHCMVFAVAVTSKSLLAAQLFQLDFNWKLRKQTDQRRAQGLSVLQNKITTTTNKNNMSLITNLTIAIVHSHFGVVPVSVFRALVFKGPCTIDDLVQHTVLPIDELKSSVGVGIGAGGAGGAGGNVGVIIGGGDNSVGPATGTKGGGYPGASPLTKSFWQLVKSSASDAHQVGEDHGGTAAADAAYKKKKASAAPAGKRKREGSSSRAATSAAAAAPAIDPELLKKKKQLVRDVLVVLMRVGIVKVWTPADSPSIQLDDPKKSAASSAASASVAVSVAAAHPKAPISRLLYTVDVHAVLRRIAFPEYVKVIQSRYPNTCAAVVFAAIWQQGVVDVVCPQIQNKRSVTPNNAGYHDRNATGPEAPTNTSWIYPTNLANQDWIKEIADKAQVDASQIQHAVKAMAKDRLFILKLKPCVSSSSDTATAKNAATTIKTTHDGSQILAATIDMDQCDNLIKNQYVLRYIRSALGSIEASIVSTIFELLLQKGQLLYAHPDSFDVVPSSTFTYTAENILHYLRTEANTTVDYLSFRKASLALSSPDMLFLNKMGDLYSIQVDKVLNKLRMTTTDGIVLDRCGKIGRRLYRLLSVRNNLEHKYLSEYALVPLKTARENLYKLLEAGFVKMIEIPTTQDMKPSRSHYLWRVDFDAVYQNIVDMTLHAMQNLILKRIDLESQMDLYAIQQYDRTTCHLNGAINADPETKRPHDDQMQLSPDKDKDNDNDKNKPSRSHNKKLEENPRLKTEVANLNAIDTSISRLYITLILFHMKRRFI